MKTSMLITDPVNKISKPNLNEYTQSIELPSKFKLYNFDSLNVRLLTTKDVKSIKNAFFTNDQNNFSVLDVLNTCCDQDIYELTHGDFYYLCAWWRINTFRNSPLSLSWDCPLCGFSNSEVIDLSSLSILELPEDFTDLTSIQLPSDNIITLRTYRLKDEKVSYNYGKVNSINDKINPQDIWIADLATILVDSSMNLSSKIEYISSLPYDDVQYIEEFQDYYTHGLPKTLNSNCKNGGCEYETDSIRLSFRLIDILPTRLDREHFRKAMVSSSQV